MRKFTPKTSRMLAMLMAMLVMLSALAMPALAEEAPSYTAINGETITMGKNLEMDKDADVPNATFTFSIAPIGAAIPAVPDNPDTTGVDESYPRVEPGPAGATISSVTFAPDDTTTAKDGDATKKIATKNISIDLTGVTFSAPGVYRWEITENATSISGVNNDPIAKRVLDIYVIDDAGTLKISGYYVYKTDGEGNVVKIHGTETDLPGYVNTLTTGKITVSKEIEGNQANRHQYFQFKVTITGATAGNQFTVTGDMDLTQTGSSGATLTADADGKAEGTYFILPGKSFVVNGLTQDMSYQVQEVFATTDNDGYTVSWKIDDAEFTAGKDTGVKSMEVADALKDQTVTVKNYKHGTVPTGILMDIWPYALIVAVAGAALIALMVSKKRRAQED